MFLISSKKFLRYSNFYIFIFPSYLSCQHWFRGWSKKNLKVYHVINCLKKNSIDFFVWYLEKDVRCDIETLSIDRVLNKKHSYGKIMQTMCLVQLVPNPFLILLNNPKQPFHARNFFKNKILWKRIIKKP